MGEIENMLNFGDETWARTWEGLESKLPKNYVWREYVLSFKDSLKPNGILGIGIKVSHTFSMDYRPDVYTGWPVGSSFIWGVLFTFPIIGVLALLFWLLF